MSRVRLCCTGSASLRRTIPVKDLGERRPTLGVSTWRRRTMTPLAQVFDWGRRPELMVRPRGTGPSAPCLSSGAGGRGVQVATCAAYRMPVRLVSLPPGRTHPSNWQNSGPTGRKKSVATVTSKSDLNQEPRGRLLCSGSHSYLRGPWRLLFLSRHDKLGSPQ